MTTPTTQLTTLIQQRIKNFWGYGNLQSDVWFIGMEEGFNDKKEILEERFRYTTTDKSVFDVYESLKHDPGQVAMFEKNGKMNRTYRRLIQIYLYFKKGNNPTSEDILNFQKTQLGRTGSDNVILELMPLPSKSIHPKDWLYSDFDIEGLSSRKEYLKIYKPRRVKALRELINKYKPKLIIFYSFNYFDDWELATGVSFDEILKNKLYITKKDNTAYVIIPHSVARGLSNNDWDEIANRIHEEVTM